MECNFLYAEKISDEKIRVYIEFEGKEVYFDVPETLLLNDIGRLPYNSNSK